MCLECLIQLKMPIKIKQHKNTFISMLIFVRRVMGFLLFILEMENTGKGTVLTKYCTLEYQSFHSQ